MGRRQQIDWGDESFEEIDEDVAKRHGVAVSAVRTERKRRGIIHGNGLRRDKPQKVIVTQLDREADIYEKLAALLEQAKTLRRLCDSAGVPLPAPLARMFVGATSEQGDDRPKRFVELEREIYEQALRRNDGSQRKAAAELGVPHSTFNDKVKQLGIWSALGSSKLKTVTSRDRKEAAERFAADGTAPFQSKQQGKHGQCYVCERAAPILATGFAANVCPDHASPLTLKNWSMAESYWGRNTVFPEPGADFKKVNLGHPELSRFRRGRPKKKELERIRAEAKAETAVEEEKTAASAPLAPVAKMMSPTSLATVQAKAIDWFWKDRIPAGMVTVFYGSPGFGKGTLTATLAAYATTGGALPADGRKRDPGRVLFVASEDNPAMTLRPRLDAAGADITQVDFFGPELGIRFPEHVSTIEAAILPSTRLVVIDPLRGHVKSDRGGTIREVLVGLEAMAGRTGVPVLIVHHSTKADAAKPLGSQDIIGIPRSVLLISEGLDGARQVTQAKKNLAPNAPPVEFWIEDCAGVGVAVFKESKIAAKPEGDERPAAKLFALPAAGEGKQSNKNPEDAREVAPPKPPAKAKQSNKPPASAREASTAASVDSDEESEEEDPPEELEELDESSSPIKVPTPQYSRDSAIALAVKRSPEGNRQWQKDLAARAKAGDREAAGQLVMSVDKIIVYLCRKVANGKAQGFAKEEDIEDMCAMARVELLEHIDSYDPKYAWSTYAQSWILCAAHRWWADHSRTVRFPVHLQDRQKSILQAKNRFIAEHGRSPTKEELREAAGVTKKLIDGVFDLWETKHQKSLDAPAIEPTDRGSKSKSVADFLGDARLNAEEEMVTGVTPSRVREVLSRLGEIHRFVLERRFGFVGPDEDGLILKKVADELQKAGLTRKRVSRERVRQIESDAIKAFSSVWKRFYGKEQE